MSAMVGLVLSAVQVSGWLPVSAASLPRVDLAVSSSAKKIFDGGSRAGKILKVDISHSRCDQVWVREAALSTAPCGCVTCAYAGRIRITKGGVTFRDWVRPRSKFWSCCQHQRWLKRPLSPRRSLCNAPRSGVLGESRLTTAWEMHTATLGVTEPADRGKKKLD